MFGLPPITLTDMITFVVYGAIAVVLISLVVGVVLFVGELLIWIGLFVLLGCAQVYLFFTKKVNL